MSWAARRRSALVGLLLALPMAVPAAVPAAAQDGPTSGLCVLTLAEVEGLTGLRFVTAHERPTACAYTSDPAEDLYALDFRIIGATSLDGVRFEYDRGGEDTTVAGYPAWSSDDGLFIDVGERLFVVQPVFFLSDVTPDPVSVQARVAELAAPRVGPALDAAFGSSDRLRALFPAAIAGQPLFAEIMAGQDFLRFADLGTAGIEAVLAGEGLTLADVTVGSAFVGDSTDLVALHVPDLDASLLVPPVSARLAGADATPEVQHHAGREVLAYPAAQLWLLVSGDVLWIVMRADEATLGAILEALP